MKRHHDENSDNEEDDMVKQISQVHGALTIYDQSKRIEKGQNQTSVVFDDSPMGWTSFAENFPAQPQYQPASIQSLLPCSLEELYEGALKKRKVCRNYMNANIGHDISKEEIFTIEIQPGWRNGTKINFKGEVNDEQNIESGDVVFIVGEKPHKLFTREGDDLIARLKVPLKESLIGYTAKLTTIDGRNLSIPIHNLIHPKYEKVVFGEGMPLTENPSKRGNLIIKFDVIYPRVLSEEQKSLISELFLS